MENWTYYIESDPKKLFGKPTIKGTRIAVDLILEKLSYGESVDQLLKAYPQLSEKSIRACLSYASETVKNEIVLPTAS